MRRLRTCLVALLLVTAGCLSNPGVGITSDNEPDPDAGVEPIQKGQSPDGTDDTSDALDDTGDGPMSAPFPSNPWTEDTVVVAVSGPPGTPGEYTDTVVEAVSYWNRYDEAYGAYEARFVVRPNATDPDIVVQFDATVLCNGREGWLGCAPVLDSGTLADGPTTVQINSGYDREIIARTVKHEFGHLLGIHHGEEPMPLMRPIQDVESPTLPSVDRRENPWRSQVIEVYVDYEGMSEERKAATKEQVQHALSYYNDGAAGTVPSNLTFVEVESRAGAEIFVQFEDEPWCREAAGSCGRTRGVDADADTEVEYHTTTTIAISNVQTEAVGWHLGYWLGDAMGASSREELAPPFHSGANRTGSWWDTD